METLIVAICWQFFKTQGFLHCAVADTPKHDINYRLNSYLVLAFQTMQISH